MRCHICGWFRPSSSPARLTVRSKCYSVLWHWVEELGNARCIEAGCELCGLAGEPHPTSVYIVERAGALFILELNAELLERELVVGDVIVITRRKTGGYTETFLRRDGHEAASELAAPGYIAALGMKQYERALELLH